MTEIPMDHCEESMTNVQESVNHQEEDNTTATDVTQETNEETESPKTETDQTHTEITPPEIPDIHSSEHVEENMSSEKEEIPVSEATLHETVSPESEDLQCNETETQNENDKKENLEPINNQPENIKLNSETEITKTQQDLKTSSVRIVDKTTDYKGFPIGSNGTTNLQAVQEKEKSPEQLIYSPIEKLVNLSDLDKEQMSYFTIAVLFNDEGDKSVTKAKEMKRHWELCDLKGNLFSLYLAIPFDVIFEKGMVVALLHPDVKSVYLNAKYKPCLFVTESKQVVNLGTSERISHCRFSEKNSSCEHLVDRTRSPFCHEHLRREYFNVSSSTQTLNMNVGLGPVKASGPRSDGKDNYETFREFKISSGNESNIEEHPWYNLPDNKKISKIIATKNSIGSRYLQYDPTTAQDEQRKKATNRAIPLQFRNKRRRSGNSPSDVPASKRRRLHQPEDSEAVRRREELLRKVSKSVKIVIA